METLTQEFGISWPLFIAQLVNIVVFLWLFIWAARWILKEGRGWEVPVWLLLAFFIPVILPILAIIHFRGRHMRVASSGVAQDGMQTNKGEQGVAPNA